MGGAGANSGAARFANMTEALRTLRTAAIWIGLIAAAWLLWVVRVAVILTFGAVVVAMLLHLLARIVHNATHLALGWSIALVTTLFFLLFAGAAWLFGTRLSTEFSDVIHNIRAGQHTLGPFHEILSGSSSFFRTFMPGALSSGLSVAEYAVVVVIAGIYLAAQPELYARGIVALFPRRQRPAAEEALQTLGATLTYWLIGQLIVMLLVGALAYLLMMAIGLPNPAALGLIAGLAEIVPYLGPFIGAVPAVLVALTLGFDTALWTVAGYLGIHIFESYLVTPLLQRRLVHIPPALILVSILITQLLFGFVGIIFAAPIAVVAYTAVNLLYLRNVLDEPVDLPDDVPV
ncbi:MAG TPA: AI-2E family transporter [Rhizomicrobium sp.]|jgi:predicted PurR-regulated permease PerM|nr:AI-2E family transporter [Rhizomicrobium sp.]